MNVETFAIAFRSDSGGNWIVAMANETDVGGRKLSFKVG